MSIIDPAPFHPESQDHEKFRTGVQVRCLPQYGGMYVFNPRPEYSQDPTRYAGWHSSVLPVTLKIGDPE